MVIGDRKNVDNEITNQPPPSIVAALSSKTHTL